VKFTRRETVGAALLAYPAHAFGGPAMTDLILVNAKVTTLDRANPTAQAVTIRDGRVLAVATRDIDIRKSGFERFVARWSQRASLSYGLAAVALSVLLGWAAGWIARRV